MSSPYIIAIVAFLLVAAFAVVAVFLGSIARLAEHLGRLFESNIKPIIMPARHLDLLALQRRMVVVALTGVTVSVAGERYLATRLRIQVSPKDYWRLANNVDGGLDRVAADLAVEIGRRAAKLGYTVPPDVQVMILQSAFVVDGRPVRAHAVREAAPASEPTPVAPPTAAPPAAARPAAAPPPSARLVAEPLPMAGTRLGATRRWNDHKSRPGDERGDTTVNIDEATLVPEVGGAVLRLGGRRTTVGRKEVGNRCDVAIDHPTVSSLHAEVRCARGMWSLVDSGSTNGTYVNDLQVSDHDLADGDRVQFSTDGPTFVFRLRTLATVGHDPHATRRSQ